MSDDDRRIFIGGLRFATEESALQEYFRQWGPLSEVKIVRYPPPDSRSKGYGFISFETQAARDNCVAEGSHTIDGKTIEIRLSDSQKKQRAATGGGGATNYHQQEEGVGNVDLEDVKFRRLFVGNIDHNWTESVISEYFKHIGLVKECTIKKGQEGKPLGFAFMTFETSKCVDKIQQLRPHTIQGRRVETKRQVAKQNVGKPEAKLEVDRVWIGAPESEKGGKGHSGLGDGHTDENLEEYFSKFGTVKKVQQLMWEDTQKKRGYGFVVFDDFDSVDKVVLARIHIINGVKIEVKKAVKDKDRLQTNNTRSGGFSSGSNMSPLGNMGGGMNGGGMGGIMNNMGLGNLMNNMGGMGNMGNMGGMGNMANMNMFGGDNAKNGRKRGIEREFPSMKKAKFEIRDPEDEIMRSIFVGNLNPKSEKADLEEYFAKFGDVSKVDIKMQSANANRNKGFAFVVFSKSCEVDNVMAARPHKLGGTNIDCKRKTPKSEGFGMEERVTKIWIGKPDPEYRIRSYGLDDTTTDDVLKEYFGKLGSVTHIHQFVWKDTNKKRGYGYISFEDADTVDKIVLLGIHEIEGVKLQCKKAVSRELQESEQRKKMGGGGMNNMNMNTMGANMNMMPPMGGMGVAPPNMQGMGNMGMNMGGMGGMQNMGMQNMGMQNMGMQNMRGMQNMGGPQSMNNMQAGGGMGGMQNNMQGMINQMQQQQQGYNGMGNNMQNMMSQMNMSTNNTNNTNNKSGNIKEMMSNMSTMMGSMKKENQKKGPETDDTTEKMMGMMGNMMTMMNNMAGMLQNTNTAAAAPKKEMNTPPPALPKTGFSGGANGQAAAYPGNNQNSGYGPPPSQGNAGGGYGGNQNSGGGYSAAQSNSGTGGYDASNYGYGY